MILKLERHVIIHLSGSICVLLIKPDQCREKSEKVLSLETREEARRDETPLINAGKCASYAFRTPLGRATARADSMRVSSAKEAGGRS